MSTEQRHRSSEPSGKEPLFPLRPEEGMEAFEVEGHIDQTPLASCRYPTEEELAQAEVLGDDPDNWFNHACACPVDRFARRSPAFGGHLDLWYWHPQTADRAVGQIAAAGLG